MDFEEDIKEFLIESNEYLSNLDREIVALEQNPHDANLISSAFRAVHTIKGTSGFFGFNLLGALTHVTESLLGDVRDGRLEQTPQTISLILESIDEVKVILTNIEATGTEGADRTTDLRRRLEEARTSKASPLAALAAIPEAVVAAPEAPPAVVVPADLPAEPAPIAEDLPPAAQREAGQLTDSTIRVDVGLLNRLMNLVGELVLARNQLLQEAPAQHASLQQTSQRLNLITTELQEGVMKTRMQPIGLVWNKLPRVVRDLANQFGKKIRIEMTGAETELDRTIIEAIKDPLTHIVRNCCDHGIEMPEQRLAKDKKPEGLIQLRAYHEGGVVNIEIVDDGAGIDAVRIRNKAVEKGLLRSEQAASLSHREACQLIFTPGFSTAAQVTSVSGRGVGMDVVKNNIERIGGNVEVLPRNEGGTIIRIKIPLTLAIIPGLVVTLHNDPSASDEGHGRRWRAEERFIIPQANLLELVRIPLEDEPQRIENALETPIFHHRGKLIPLVDLGKVLGRSPAAAKPRDSVNIVVLHAEQRKFGLIVDGICDTQEIVVKPLGRQLKGLTCYVGATIMGDGRTSLILDVMGLARLGGLNSQAKPVTRPEAEVTPLTGTDAAAQRLLIFRAGSFERVAVPLALVDRLEEIETASIERAAGRNVLNYRGAILPLVTLQEMITPGYEQRDLPKGKTHVIVFSDGLRRLGLMVDCILDIVEEVITARHPGTAPGLLGSAILCGRITDLLDLPALLAVSSDHWLVPAPESRGHAKSEAAREVAA